MAINIENIIFEEDAYYNLQYYPLWGKPERPKIINLVVQYKFSYYSSTSDQKKHKFIVLMSNDKHIEIGKEFTISDRATMYKSVEKI